MSLVNVGKRRQLPKLTFCLTMQPSVLFGTTAFLRLSQKLRGNYFLLFLYWSITIFHFVRSAEVSVIFTER